MRRILTVLVLLAGCAVEKGDAKLADPVETTAERLNTTTTAPEVPTTRRGEYAIGDRVETGAGNFVTLHAYEQPIPPAEYSEPDAGQEFAAADLEFCLGPAEEIEGLSAIGPTDFELQMGDNTRRQFDLSLAREPAMHYTDLTGPGECLRGWVTFQVPAGVRPAYVVMLHTDPAIKFSL